MTTPKGKQEEKIKAHYNTGEYYKYYKEKHFGRNKSSKYYVDKQLYTKVLKDFFDLVVEDLIMNGSEFILPSNMGKIQIRKYKATLKMGEDGKLINHLPVDYGATNKLRASNPEAAKNKVVIRHLNKHTDGYTFRYIYIKNKARYKNKSAYSFKMTRTNKLKVTNSVRIYKKKIDFLKLF